MGVCSGPATGLATRRWIGGCTTRAAPQIDAWDHPPQT
jgi:hypothetical protein